MNHTYTWTVKKDKDRDLYRIRRSDGFEANPSPRSLLSLAVGVQCNNVEMCHDVLRQVDETGEAEFTTTTVGGSLHHL